MRKNLFTVGVLLSITLTLSAAKEDVPMTIATTGHDTKITTVKRTPVYMPLEVTYDDNTHVIEIKSEGDIEAEVYMKTEEGDILGYSSCLNTTLNLPVDYRGLLTISIEGADWTAVGEIEI